MKAHNLPKALAKPVYLANAYTSHLADKSDASMQMVVRLNYESLIAGKLKKKFKGKYCFLLPIAMSSMIAKFHSFDNGFDTWAKDDYTWISICDEVWTLMSDGWLESYGVLSELKFAKAIGKPIKFIDPSSLEILERPTGVPDGHPVLKYVSL